MWKICFSIAWSLNKVIVRKISLDRRVQTHWYALKNLSTLVVLTVWVRKRFVNGCECLNPEEQVFLMSLIGAPVKFTHSWPHLACSALFQEDWWKTVSGVAGVEACNSQQKSGLLSKTVLLHHDSACPHTVVTAIQTIENLKFEVLPHSPYSPDLALCHFCAVGPLKEALRCCWFGSGEVKLALYTWNWKQPRIFFFVSSWFHAS